LSEPNASSPAGSAITTSHPSWSAFATAVRFKFADRLQGLDIANDPASAIVPDTNRVSVVMVGPRVRAKRGPRTSSSRPSTSFCFLCRAKGRGKKPKTKEKRGWSAFADHDGWCERD
jgi:hypothetical protein